MRVTFRFFRDSKAQPQDVRRGAIFFTPIGLEKDIAGSVLSGQYGTHAVWTEREMVPMDVTIGKAKVRGLVPKMVDGKQVFKPLGVSKDVQSMADAAIDSFWNVPNILGATIDKDEDTGEMSVIDTTTRNVPGTRTALKGATEAIQAAGNVAITTPAPVITHEQPVQSQEHQATNPDDLPY